MISIIEYNDKYLNDLTDMFNLWDNIDDLSPEQMAKTVIAYQNNTKNKTYLAINDNNVAVGYIFCGLCYFVGTNPFLEIIQIMLKEDYRGKGIGRLMMNYVIDEYYNKGIRQVRLHSRMKLKKAHKFYEKMGFCEFKESKFFIKNL